MSKAAKILGVDRKTLYRRRDELSHNVHTGDIWDIQ
jgi:transcriptional regulator of acetoin/glycerol metabolism